MKSLALNLAIASIWLLLSESPTPWAFAAGFLLGFVLIAMFRHVLGSETYVRRSLGLIRFFGVFLYEFLVANLKVAFAILFRSRESLYPRLVRYETRGLEPLEILILSYCVTLTPGTTVVQISDDFQFLILHALDARDPNRLRQSVDQSLKEAILRFMR